MAKRYFQAHETALEDTLEGLPLASFPQRSLGFLIDFAVVIAIWAPVVLGWKYLVTHRFHGETNVHIEFHPHDPESFVFMFVYFALVVFLTGGRTLGKWVSGTRIVSLTHPHMGFWQSAERALGYGASFLEGGFGFVQYFIHRNRMCVHDRIADTIVVDVRKSAKRLASATQP